MNEFSTIDEDYEEQMQAEQQAQAEYEAQCQAEAEQQAEAEYDYYMSQQPY